MVLTQRDKKLLYFLAVVVIVVGLGAFIILPQWNKHGQLADQLEEVQTQQNEMEVSIASLDVLRGANSKAKTDYTQSTKAFYEVMESHAAERMITKVFLSHNLSTIEFDISPEPQTPQMAAYISSAMGTENGVTEDQAKAHAGGVDVSSGSASDSAELTTDTTEENADSEDGEGQDQEEIQVQNIYVDYIVASAVGSTEDMKALIDDLVNNYPSIQVTSFNMSSQISVDEELKAVDKTTIVIGMNLYMADKDEQ